MPFLEQHAEYFRTLNSVRVPNPMRVIGTMIILTFVIVTVFLTFAPWVQTSAGMGVVTSLNPNDRMQEVNALVSGRIQEWYIRDGSPVKMGDPIVEIVDNDPLLIERLEGERAQVITRQQAAESAVQTAEIDLNRMQDLYDRGLASRREFEQAQIRVNDLRGRLAEATAELNRIDTTITRQSAQIVRAPRDGVILRVNAGDAATFVNAGDVVATFLPTNIKRAVELFIDGRDVALVTPGAKVRLQFEGWPAVQFSGWPSVAIGTFGGEVISIDPSASPNGRFRVLVVEDKTDPNPWPEERFVRLGSGARGWILLNEVSVGYELWRQLNNFPPQFPGREAPNTPAASGG